MGWGQRVLKSASRKNSQLLSTWPCTIVRKRREGRMDGRTDGAREQGGYRGRGVGGQRLKLHHKSHPERKHWVTPPPQSIHSSPFSPLRPGPLLFSSPASPSPPFVSANRVPHGPTRCILYYSFMYFKRQTAQFLLTPSPLDLLLLLSFSLHLSACCKAINHLADLISKGKEKNQR